MRKSVILAASIAACAAGPLAAQTLTYEMNAQVAPMCGVYSSSGTVINVDFGSLFSVDPATTVNAGAGSATYRCNSVTGFTRTIASQNNGWLTLDGNATTDNARRIRFNMAHGGGSSLGFAAQQLTAPLTRNFPAASAMLNGQTGGVSFQAFGVRGPLAANGVPGTTVMAGNYRDTVTITLTAN